MREGLSKMRAFRLRPLSCVKGGCMGCILIWSNDGEGDGVGPGALGDPGRALGRGSRDSEGWGWGVARPLVPIGPIDPFKGILLWILTYMDPQDPILYPTPPFHRTLDKNKA